MSILDLMAVECWKRNNSRFQWFHWQQVLSVLWLVNERPRPQVTVNGGSGGLSGSDRARIRISPEVRDVIKVTLCVISCSMNIVFTFIVALMLILCVCVFVFGIQQISALH